MLKDFPSQKWLGLSWAIVSLIVEMWLANWIEINLESVLSHSESVLIHIKSVNIMKNSSKLLALWLMVRWFELLILEKCAFQIELFVSQNVALEMCFCIKTKIYK